MWIIYVLLILLAWTIASIIAGLLIAQWIHGAAQRYPEIGGEE